MTITTNTPVGEVVKLNFKTAPLFQANKIDYCCGGNKTISEACAEVGIEPEKLIERLEEISSKADPDTLYINNLPLKDLCDYIVRRHHTYVTNSIPFLIKSLDKICGVHGLNHPELFEINKLFKASAGELVMHMQKEELTLFPYIKKMERSMNEGIELGPSHFGSVENPIKMMLTEHDIEGKRFDKISKLSNAYRLPEDGCTTYKVTINLLKEFEDDLHRHIHLENNILFPKAIKMEAELNHQKEKTVKTNS